MKFFSGGTSAASAASLHNPARGENESFAAYKARRAVSHLAVQSVICAGLGGGISSRQHFRDSMRANGTMGKRIRAADAILAAIAAKRIPKWEGPRDEHGAYTAVGSTYTVQGPDIEPTSREHVLGGAVGGGEDPAYTARRKWLAGISAQRGY